MHSKILFLALILGLTLVLVPACSGDDDDDDSDNDDDNGNGSESDCEPACERLNECDGGVIFQWGSFEECVEDCHEWFDFNPTCASCSVGCWTSGLSCSDAFRCDIDCIRGPCLEDTD